MEGKKERGREGIKKKASAILKEKLFCSFLVI